MTEETAEKKPISVAEKKAQRIEWLQNKFNSPDMRDRLINLAKGDESLVIANLNSFFTILINDEGSGKWNEKKYLVDATTSSLALCFMESMQIGIPIDRRGLVHIVVYGQNAELEIDYRGFIYYLNKHYNSADFDVKLVFEGDTFRHWSQSGDDHYEYKQDTARKTNDYSKVIWAFCYMTYVKNGRERSKIEVMDKRELQQVRGKAKTKNVWDEWLGEMYKKAVVRRSCKLPLAAVDENAIEAIDNKNFLIDKPAAADRLQLLYQTQREMLNADKTEGENPPPQNTDEPVDADNAENPVAHSRAGQNPEGDQRREDHPLEGVELEDANGKDAGPPDDARPKAGVSGDAEPNCTDAQYSDIKPRPSPAPEWDGKTLVIGGKPQAKDFETESAALNYLRKVMSSRKHKASRKAIIEENPLFMAALIRTGNGSAIADLHRLADAGD